jgi:hypothetical protein
VVWSSCMAITTASGKWLVRRRLPLLHILVLFLLQQLRGATAARGGAPPSAPASPCELRGPDCSSLMVRQRVCGCDGAGSWTCG